MNGGMNGGVNGGYAKGTDMDRGGSSDDRKGAKRKAGEVKKKGEVLIASDSDESVDEGKGKKGREESGRRRQRVPTRNRLSTVDHQYSHARSLYLRFRYSTSGLSFTSRHRQTSFVISSVLGFAVYLLLGAVVSIFVGDCDPNVSSIGQKVALIFVVFASVTTFIFSVVCFLFGKRVSNQFKHIAKSLPGEVGKNRLERARQLEVSLGILVCVQAVYCAANIVIMALYFVFGLDDADTTTVQKTYDFYVYVNSPAQLVASTIPSIGFLAILYLMGKPKSKHRQVPLCTCCRSSSSSSSRARARQPSSRAALSENEKEREGGRSTKKIGGGSGGGREEGEEVYGDGDGEKEGMRGDEKGKISEEGVQLAQPYLDSRV
mmetsp:Transcript_11234/g.29655  ORF Transcript_11234/g.29655 Transcript_11234/m.29655 type:complete len:376 (-) Transcript_11234:492-1619(-)